MEDSEHVHHHYWPGEGTISLTPQARRYGYTFDVHTTKSVWGECITWTPQKKRGEVNSETRIYDLLHACYVGMGKALASTPGCVFFEFKHWYWDRFKPEAKKKRKHTFGARLMLDPDTEEPWLLLFDPLLDGEEVLIHGEPKPDRADEDGTGEKRDSSNTELDIGAEAV